MRTWLLLVVSSFLIGAAEEQFVRLDWPDGQLRQRPDSCPIRMELPVGKVFANEHGGRYTTTKVRAVSCYYASLQSLRITSEKGHYDPTRREVVPGGGYYVVVKTEVFLPGGGDQLITLKYSLLQGAEEMASGTEVLEGDQAELNWGEGVQMQVARAKISGTPEPVLRVEVSFTPR